MFCSIFWELISINALGNLISTPKLFMSTFVILPLDILAPTLISGISNIFLFNIIGSFISPLNILLIFNG